MGEQEMNKKASVQQTQKQVIAGKTVNVASSKSVKASSQKVKGQYAKALENLKNR